MLLRAASVVMKKKMVMKEKEAKANLEGIMDIIV
jgi:hypothetical protein